jgi:hypothetical protein
VCDEVIVEVEERENFVDIGFMIFFSSDLSFMMVVVTAERSSVFLSSFHRSNLI